MLRVRLWCARSVKTKDLPVELREQLKGIETLYAALCGKGERLALVKDRQLAFVLASQNDLSPVAMHWV